MTPLISAKGSILIAKLKSVNSGMPPTCRLTSSSLSIGLVSPVPKRFLLQEILDKSVSQVSYFVPRVCGFLHIQIPHSLFHLLWTTCQFHQSSQVPWVNAINVRSPSSRRFCIPSVSSIAGPFTKFSAPNVTNKAINSTIDYFHYRLEEFLYQVVRDFRVDFCQEGRGPSGSQPSSMLSVLSNPSCPYTSWVQKVFQSNLTLCSRTQLSFLRHFPPGSPPSTSRRVS